MADDLNFGSRSGLGAARERAASVARRAQDELGRLRLKLAASAEALAPEEVVAEWRSLAKAATAPHSDRAGRLAAATLACWTRLPLSDRILCMDAWGFIQASAKQKAKERQEPGQPASGTWLPRPLLRAMAASLWSEGGEATLSELNLCAVRTDAFFDSATDLARSILDAVVHACAQRVRKDFREASSMGPVLSMAPFVSRTRSAQAELHELRRAAADCVDPVQEAVYSRVAWAKNAYSCDSFTAWGTVAKALARDSMESGGSMRAVFIKAFGCAPEALNLVPTPQALPLAAEEQALEAWRRERTAKLAQDAAAGGSKEGRSAEGGDAGQGVQASAVSVCTVHSDGRSETPDSSSPF